MPRFFISPTEDNELEIIGEDAKHIKSSLRMKEGEKLTLSDGTGIDYICEIASFCENTVKLNVLKKEANRTEADIKLTIFQGLPKGDKLELIIQKCTELGCESIVPFISSRCVSRPDSKSLLKKCERWNKIALESAKQSMRGMLPKVYDVMDFKSACDMAKEYDAALFFYEGGGISLTKVFEKLGKPKKVAVMIGPEGGFSEEEVNYALKSGMEKCTLGPRILRTETAPIVASAAVMLLSGNMEKEGNMYE